MRFWPTLMILALAACGSDDSMTRTFAVSRDGGQDTTSSSPPPLSVPPAFLQRPSQPALGKAGRLQAEPSTGSSGQNALVDAAGPAAPGDIRQLIDENSGAVSLGPTFAERIMDWTPPPGYVPLATPAKAGWFSRWF